MTLNPFRKLLSDLITSEFQLVTLPFLKTVSEIVNEPAKIIITYGEAFQVLEFLATAKVVELVPVDEQNKQYKVRKFIDGN